MNNTFIAQLISYEGEDSDSYLHFFKAKLENDFIINIDVYGWEAGRFDIDKWFEIEDKTHNKEAFYRYRLVKQVKAPHSIVSSWHKEGF